MAHCKEDEGADDDSGRQFFRGTKEHSEEERADEPLVQLLAHLV